MCEKTASILIVDPDRKLISRIRGELNRQGFLCRTARGFSAARRLLEVKNFDLLITSFSLPRGGGLDLLSFARQYAPDCKVILISRDTKREYIAKALMLGAYDYIERPLAVDELVDVVSKALSGETQLPELPVRAAAAMKLSEQARRASLDSVRALVRAVEAKDPYTCRHSEQVAHYAVSLASVLGLPRDEVESVRVAALLHDVGKIGVPDHILTKPGQLTDEEFEHIRAHPALGAEILSNISLFGREAQFVRHHHERWDGNGYPDGLSGEEIPFISRIIQTADCIDAMLMERTYKSGYSVTKMLGELSRCAGSQFDPAIATAARKWCMDHSDLLILPGQPVPDERFRELEITPFFRSRIA